MQSRHASILTLLFGLAFGVGLTAIVGLGPQTAQAKRKPPTAKKARQILELTRDASNATCVTPSSIRADCCPRGFSLAGVSVRGTGTPVVVCLEN